MIVVSFPPLFVTVKLWRFTAPPITRLPAVAVQFWLPPRISAVLIVSVMALLLVMPAFTVSVPAPPSVKAWAVLLKVIVPTVRAVPS